MLLLITNAGGGVAPDRRAAAKYAPVDYFRTKEEGTN